MNDKVRIELSLRRTVNYAMQQNDVPVLTACRLVNDSEQPLREVVISFSSEPRFAEPLELRVERVEARSAYQTGPVDLTLAPGYLRALEERLEGLIRVAVSSRGGTLLERTEPVSVLAYDEWAGTALLPELLAAFVMPNHPAVEQILSAASDFLTRSGRGISLSGYQTGNREHALAIVEAIFHAVKGLGIRYVNPPASFEETGQKVRTPGRILDCRLGTCLDMATLFAACLEQAGLNPLICLTQNHAFPGVWLVDQHFPDAFSTRADRVRKRVQLDEICVFEATLATADSQVDFMAARRTAFSRLAEGSPFAGVLDVRRARSSRILPLPTGSRAEVQAAESIVSPESRNDRGVRSTQVQSSEAARESSTEARESAAPKMASPRQDIHSTETPAERLERWKRRLLDLSTRNRLLKFRREGRKAVRLLVPDLNLLLRALGEGQTFTVVVPPAELRTQGPRDHDLHRDRTGEDIPREVILGELRKGRLTASPESWADLQRRLLELYREARSSMEENGANTLFLAAGFLAWCESDKPADQNLAPLVLVPLEIRRKSVSEPFEVKQSDEEPTVNVTLLERLRHDFGLEVSGLEGLPGEDGVVDIGKVLRRFRQAVRDIDGWEVIEDSYIALFTFQKFLMWKDLQARAETILQNDLVNHLVNTPTLPYRDQGEFPDPETLDECYSPADLLCPLDADASQLSAVIAAAQGKTFVLQGPPGTGKSQTIANMIAHCLSLGKTVLFVSEKMAALEVVHRRLNQAGLAEFCLELHSAKSNKRTVLESLGCALEATKTRPPEDWQQEADRLAATRNDLNSYVRALHRRRDIGNSVFEVISELVRLRRAPRVRLGWDKGVFFDRQRFNEMTAAVSRLSQAAARVEPAAYHPWRGTGCHRWEVVWEQQIREAISDLLQRSSDLKNAARRVSGWLGFEEAGWSERDLRAMNSLSKLLLECRAIPASLLVEPSWAPLRAEIDRWISHGRRRDTLREQLFSRYDHQILNLDLGNLKQRMEQAGQSWWLPRQMTLAGVRRKLARLRTQREKLSEAQMQADIAAAIELNTQEEFLGKVSSRASQLLGPLWREGNANWDEIERVKNAASDLRKLATYTAGSDVERSSSLRNRWALLLTEAAEQLAEGGELRLELTRYVETAERFAECRNQVSAALELDREAVWGDSTQDGHLDRVETAAQRWLESLSSLDDWCQWQAARREALDLQLEEIVASYERGELPARLLTDCFLHSFYYWWLEKTLPQEQVLNRFIGQQFEQTIETFKQLDSRFLDLTRQQIRARLAARLPGKAADTPAKSETGILRLELKKKARFKPIRRLFREIRNLLPRIKPCLLMSPLSVAQYLDPSLSQFDLVIFDEASQIPVWDAVGAIGRARQAVIVGDSKQLPPTTFFMRVDDSEDYNNEETTNVEDLESVLDDCLAAGIPERYLEWHYRSRHESLISFSNRNYYSNRLLVFPSPHREIGVQLRRVAGTYDRAGSRTNRQEAAEVVKEIVGRLSDPQRSSETIGVVTFNINQQRLIEDLLERARRANPEIERHFHDDSAPAGEAVFVKNLETVQGDERDVILLSVCYGPDEAGRVSMNFGPLNRDGGERRLNVAVTRARKELLVFTSLKVDQINLAQTQATAVRHLKEFLDYAERGEAAFVDQAIADPLGKCESFLEEEVCQALRSRGYEVHPQVGCSGYRIDLAIVHPHCPGKYLLGIECDGANYHRAKTARDRDRIREMVLTNLGWRLHRIWSTDWWRNPDRELDRVERAIQLALEEAAPTPGPDTPTHPTVSAAPLEGSPVEPVSLSGTGKQPQLAKQSPVYTPTAVKKAPGGLQAFHDAASSPRIREVLEKVVREEGPISVPLACRRVAAHWGIERVSEKVARRIREIAAASGVRTTKDGSRSFFWPPDVQPGSYPGFRVPGKHPDSRRDAQDLPPEEVANAAAHLMEQMISLPVSDLTREVARLFGFDRAGKEIAAFIREGIDMLIASGRATLEGDRITVR